MALARFVAGASAAEVKDAVQEIEHRADDYVRKMEDALARTFVTPLDREDLHRLATDLDDVVDGTNLAARTCAVYGVSAPSEAMKALIDILMQCTEKLKTGIPELRRHGYPAIIELSRELRDLEKRADTIFRSAISALFSNPEIEAKELLRQKEVLDHLELAVDHCDGVANLLTNLSVKHG